MFECFLSVRPIITSARDCMERIAAEVTYISSGTLNRAESLVWKVASIVQYESLASRTALCIASLGNR